LTKLFSIFNLEKIGNIQQTKRVIDMIIKKSKLTSALIKCTAAFVLGSVAGGAIADDGFNLGGYWTSWGAGPEIDEVVINKSSNPNLYNTFYNAFAFPGSCDPQSQTQNPSAIPSDGKPCFESGTYNISGLDTDNINNDIVEKAHKNNEKVILSIGGYEHYIKPDPSGKPYEPLIFPRFQAIADSDTADSQTVDIFATNIASYVKNNNYDGVGLDFEMNSITFPSSTGHTKEYYREKEAKLVESLKDRLNDKIIVVTLSPLGACGPDETSKSCETIKNNPGLSQATAGDETALIKKLNEDQRLDDVNYFMVDAYNLQGPRVPRVTEANELIKACVNSYHEESVLNVPYNKLQLGFTAKDVMPTGGSPVSHIMYRSQINTLLNWAKTNSLNGAYIWSIKDDYSVRYAEEGEEWRGTFSQIYRDIQGSALPACLAVPTGELCPSDCEVNGQWSASYTSDDCMTEQEGSKCPSAWANTYCRTKTFS
jgi:hypothetical protein